MSGRHQYLQSAAAMPDVSRLGTWAAGTPGSLLAKQPAADRVKSDADGDARDAAGGRTLRHRDAQGLRLKPHLIQPADVSLFGLQQGRSPYPMSGAARRVRSYANARTSYKFS